MLSLGKSKKLSSCLLWESQKNILLTLCKSKIVIFLTFDKSIKLVIFLTLGKSKDSHLPDFWQVKKNSYLADFCKSKKNILLTFGKSKNSHFAHFEQVKNQTHNKILLGETAYLSILEVTTLYHRHSTPAFHTSEGLHQLWALPWHKAFFFKMLRYPVF